MVAQPPEDHRRDVLGIFLSRRSLGGLGKPWEALRASALACDLPEPEANP
jgi:hypothetical protein